MARNISCLVEFSERPDNDLQDYQPAASLFHSKLTDKSRGSSGVLDWCLKAVEARDEEDAPVVGETGGQAAGGGDVGVQLVHPGPLHHHSSVVDGALRQVDRLLSDLPGNQRNQTVERGVWTVSHNIFIIIVITEEGAELRLT